MIVKVAMFYSFLSNNHLIRSDIARDFFIHCQINSSYCMHLFTTTDFFCLLYQIDTCVQHEFAHLLFHPQNFFAVRFTNGGFRCILVFAFFIPFLHIGGTLHVDLFLGRGSPQPYARARARHARRRSDRAGLSGRRISLGIAARNAGLNAFQGFLVSLLNNASAGEYAGFTTIAADASYLEIAVVTLIANARYLLMSCSLSQKFAPGTPMRHRLLVGYDVTDELFGLAISCDGWLDPYYMYGAILVAAPSWAVGTALGVVVGNLLPARVVSALSVALYGMFLAIIIPPARKNKVVAALVLLSFALSFACGRLPLVSSLSSGTRTILLTVALSAGAALLFPVKDAEKEGNAP